MNIALFASAFHPHIGGVEELTRQLAIEYRRRGIGVVVLTNRWPRSLAPYEVVDGVDVVRLPFRYRSGSLKSLISYKFSHRTVRKELLGLLRERQIDVLHVQCINASTAYAVYAKRTLGLPLVVSSQGERTMDASGLFQNSHHSIAIFHEAVLAADVLTACSRNTMADIQMHVGVPPNHRCQVIYNGIRLSDLCGPQTPALHSRPFVLAIGRLVRQKGFDVLLHAWAQAQVRSCDLVLAGEGPERSSLEQLAKELNLTNVRFFGRADRPSVISLFQTCSFFVLPSRQEPLGIVNLEAMAAGKAVIASRTGGVVELVEDGVNGILVTPEDPGSLAKAITALIADPLLCAKLGYCGRSRATAFDWSRIAEQYVSIYLSLIKTSVTIDTAVHC
jgi:glycogen(starch) synthase